jgi:hypothetical protein
MIELYKRYEYTAPDGTISNTGIEQINYRIIVQNLTTEEWQTINPGSTAIRLPSLPDDWEWRWLVIRGEYRGTFPKRVRAYYWKTFNIKCPDTFIEAIGNIARDHSTLALTYRFEFVDRVDWQPGDFGDHTSCYWGEYAGSRYMIEENAWGVCFYDPIGNGFARAWFATISDDQYVVFNGHGFDGNATLVTARTLAAWLNLSYKKIALKNQGATSGALWIDAGIGYVIGLKGDIESITTYDLDWREIWVKSCNGCGDEVDDDDVYYDPDGYPYCSHCFYNFCDYCSECSEVHYHNELTWVTGDAVCEECLSEHYSYCDGCEEYLRDTEVEYDETDKAYYCEDCRKNNEKDEGA